MARSRMPAAAVLAATAAAFSPGAALPQQPAANTEIYLADLALDSVPLTGRTPIVNISNSPGWDNQPTFTPDGDAVLFSSMRDGKQRDIYRYDIGTSTLTRLTHTAESEYSPLVTPDGRTFSVVRVELDNTQRLWRFDMDGSNPRLVLENVKGVGYHAWLDATHVALFILGAGGQPNTLQCADTTTGAVTMIDSSPGHGLAVRRGPGPNGEGSTLTYVCKTDPAHWVVKEFNPVTKAVTVLTDALQGSEDLAWDPYGATRTRPANRLLMARGPKIFASSIVGGQDARPLAGRTAAAEGTWAPVGDFTSQGIDHITRLAIRSRPLAGAGPRLVFVAEPVSK
jgi:dipeptidyl aminopeptidase/acylaminoacyl peptidase